MVEKGVIPEEMVYRGNQKEWFIAVIPFLIPCCCAPASGTISSGYDGNPPIFLLRGELMGIDSRPSQDGPKFV